MFANLRLLCELGRGTYGVVTKVQCTTTGTKYAVKTLENTNDEDGINPTTLREISTLRELIHPNIVRLLDIDLSNKKLKLLFEFMDYDLHKYMARHNVDNATVRSFMQQLLSGLTYCHRRRILHRDLKPQNILINTAGVLKIADFGLVRAFSIPMPSYTDGVVTLWYRAPELLLGEISYSTPIDVWSVGCIFVEMLTNGKPLFAKQSEIEQVTAIFEVCGSPTEQTWPGISQIRDFASYATYPGLGGVTTAIPDAPDEAKQLLQQLMVLDPAQRITAKQALSHPYIGNMI